MRAEVTPDGDAVIALYQAQLVVAVDARRPSTSTGITGRAATPRIVGATWLTSYARSKPLNQPNSYIQALETSATADGRLMVAQGANWTINAQPWNPNTWWPQRKLVDLYSTTRTLSVCRNYDTSGNPSCRTEELAPFGRVYPIAAQPLYRADGSRLPAGSGFDNCGYMWITPEGTDVFCRPDRDSFGLELEEGFESSTGMHFFSVGQHSGWVLRRLDGPINLRRFNPDRLAGSPIPNENLGTDRPFSLLFLNTSTGFWAENRRDASASLPILRQWPLFQFMVQSNSLISSRPRKRARCSRATSAPPIRAG